MRRKMMITNRTRLSMLYGELKHEFKDNAKVTLSGYRFVIEAEPEVVNEKYKFSVSYKTESFLKILTVPDEELQYEIEKFVASTRDEVKQRVRSEASSKILSAYYWIW